MTKLLLKINRTHVLLAATLVCAVLVVGFFVVRNATHAAEACAPNQANAEASPKLAGTGNVETYILGDSYVSGFALTNPVDGFAYKLAALEGWSATVDGFPGSGFATGSACGDQEYAKRVTNIPG